MNPSRIFLDNAGTSHETSVQLYLRVPSKNHLPLTDHSENQLSDSWTKVPPECSDGLSVVTTPSLKHVTILMKLLKLSVWFCLLRFCLLRFCLLRFCLLRFWCVAAHRWRTAAAPRSLPEPGPAAGLLRAPCCPAGQRCSRGGWRDEEGPAGDQHRTDQYTELLLYTLLLLYFIYFITSNTTQSISYF